MLHHKQSRTRTFLFAEHTKTSFSQYFYVKHPKEEQEKVRGKYKTQKHFVCSQTLPKEKLINTPYPNHPSYPFKKQKKWGPHSVPVS